MTTAGIIVDPAVSAKPVGGLTLLSNVEKAIWYPCHEGTGTTLTEKLGLGGPNLTEGASAGTEWANWGYVTPTGAANGQFASPLGNAYLQALFNMATLTSGGQILVGAEIAHDGDLTTNEALVGYGRSVNVSGSRGHLSLRMGSNESWLFVTHGGEGASSGVSSTFGGTGSTGITAMQQVVLSLTWQSGTAFNIVLYRYVVGVGYTTTVSTSHDPTTNGGYVPQIDGSALLSLFAIQTASAPTYSTYMGAAAGSNAKVNNFWAARLTVANSGAGQGCLDSMVLAPREFPLYLRRT